MKTVLLPLLILIHFFCFSQTDTIHHIISTPLPKLDSNSDSLKFATKEKAVVNNTDTTSLIIAPSLPTMITDSDSSKSDSVQIEINNSPSRFIELGIAPTGYKGELNTYNHWNIGWHIGLLLARKKRLNGEFTFFGGQISGQNSQFKVNDASKTPNTFFKTIFISGSYNLHVNIIAKPRLKLYVSQGIGFMNFTPQNALYDNLVDEIDTRPLNEEYSTTTLMLPTQVGAHYSLKNNFSFGVKVTWLNTRTDYLDNISEWGNVDNNDNILAYKVYALVPLPARKDRKAKKEANVVNIPTSENDSIKIDNKDVQENSSSTDQDNSVEKKKKKKEKKQHKKSRKKDETESSTDQNDEVKTKKKKAKKRKEKAEDENSSTSPNDSSE